MDVTQGASQTTGYRETRWIPYGKTGTAAALSGLFEQAAISDLETILGIQYAEFDDHCKETMQARFRLIRDDTAREVAAKFPPDANGTEFHNLALNWTHLLQCTRTRTSGSRVDRLQLESWDTFAMQYRETPYGLRTGTRYSILITRGRNPGASAL